MTHTVTPILGVDLDATPSANDQGLALGTTVYANDGGVYQFVQAGTVITQYDCVAIDEDNLAYPVNKTRADDGWRIGIADQGAFADEDYGWVRIDGGTSTVRVAGSCAADVALYTTSTEGVLDDTSATQTRISGIVITASNGTSATASVECIVTHPFSEGVAA